MCHLRKQEAIHQVELILNITLLTSVELLCGRIQVIYLFHEWLDVKSLLYLIILVRLKRYHDSITDLTSNINNGSLQLNLLQKHMLFLNVIALYSWNPHTLKVHRSFAFCNILQLDLLMILFLSKNLNLYISVKNVWQKEYFLNQKEQFCQHFRSITH